MEDVPVPKEMEFAAEPVTVHEGPVRAAEISQMIAGVRLYDESVLPERCSLVQHDIALVVTTQDGRSMRQGYDIAVAWPTIHYQDRVAAGVIDGASLAVSLRAHLERLLTGPADLTPTRPNCTETATSRQLELCFRFGRLRLRANYTQGRDHQPSTS